MIGTGLSYGFRNFIKLKLDIIASYNFIKNKSNMGFNSELGFTTLDFSLKYEFGGQ
jgi:hypothetical protein